MSALLEAYVVGVVATTILCGVSYTENDGFNELNTLITVLAWPVFGLLLLAYFGKLVVLKAIGR